MKVLHVIDRLDIDAGGPPRSVIHTASHLRKIGIFSNVLFFDAGKKLFKLSDCQDHSDVSGISYSPIRQQWGMWSAIRKVFQQWEPHLVHIHGMWAWINHLTCRESFERRLPYIIAPRGMLEPWSLKQKPWKKRIALWTYQRADLNRSQAIHCTSHIEAKSLVENGYKTNSFVVPNGAEIPTLRDKADSKNKRRVLFLSRIHAKKGLRLLIEAWNAVAIEEWECIVCGPDYDGHLEEVRRIIAQHGLKDNIRILPAVEGVEKSELYRTADIFILPSRSENFGLVVAEAMSFGIPVITTDKTPWAVIKEKGCGWWVNDTVENLTVALRQAMSLSDSERRIMGARGRALVEERFTWDAVAMQLKEHYERIVGTNGYRWRESLQERVGDSSGVIPTVTGKDLS